MPGFAFVRATASCFSKHHPDTIMDSLGLRGRYTDVQADAQKPPGSVKRRCSQAVRSIEQEELLYGNSGDFETTEREERADTG